MALVKAAALFGDGQMEEGYAALETSIEYCNRSSRFKIGEPLCTGNKEILGDIKLLYNKAIIQLPDGAVEPVSYDYRLNFNISGFLGAITAKSGWEWFNSVRDEDRFKEYITRAKKMANELK